MIKSILYGAAPLALIATPAHAEVKTLTEQGFSTLHAADVLAKPEDVWKRLLAPKDWWNPAHSWSGSVDGFYIDPQAGGCFCELFHEKDKDGKIIPKGSVEHLRVIFAQPAKVLRMQGGLGPLQAEAVNGTLTVAMEPLKNGGGTRVSFSYVVGGYMRFKTADIAPAVDNVLREQFERMIKPLGKVVGNEASVPTAKDAVKADPKVAPAKGDATVPASKDVPKADPKVAPAKGETATPTAKAPTVADPKKPATDADTKVGKPEKVEPVTPTKPVPPK